MKRKKILCMTDSPKLHTGFARVGKQIMTHLNATGKYEIACVGWFHQQTNEDVSYPIWHTQLDEQGKTKQEDKYATFSFPGYVDKFKPDIVWTLGDMWMIDHVAKAPNRNTFKWVAYFPIDGEPVPSKWGAIVDPMDVGVAYGAYGKNIISKRTPNKNIRFIYHGVDTDIFHRHPPEARLSHRKNLLNIPEDRTLLGLFARNQPRKAFDKAFEAYFYVLNGMYLSCNKCKMLTVHPFDVVTRQFTMKSACSNCASTDCTKGEPNLNVSLYLHAAPVDCGWDLIDLQHDYDLTGRVLINPQLRVGMGVSEQTLSALYNSLDIFTLPTRGEGFGLPIIEAMACGVPVVVTGYSAHTEWVGNGGILVPPVALEAEPLTNIRRAVIDMNAYVTALVSLIKNDQLRKKMGVEAERIAKGMAWKDIVLQWEKLIDGVLYPEGVPDNLNPIDYEYTLEVM